MSGGNSSFVFRMREEVQSVGTALHDSLTGVTYPLNPIGCAITDAIRTPLKADALVNKVVGACGTSQTQVERVLRQMILLGLLEGTCSDSRERLRRIHNGERLAARTLEGSRFSCQNSGACCRGYIFGSISAEEKARIEALEPRKALLLLGEVPLFIEAGVSSGQPVYRLATRGDACVFLEERRFCGLHRVFGAAAKPALCQLYPLSGVATIEGLKIYDRGECATFAVSARSGTLLEEDLPRIRSLVDKEIHHPVVQIHKSWQCDYGVVLALARRLDSEAKSRSPFDALHAIGHVTRNFIVALMRCPLEEGEPEAAVAKALQCSADEFRPSQATSVANVRTGLRAMSILADALMGRVAANEALAQNFRRAASLLSEACRVVLGESPLSERARAAFGVSVENDVESALRLSVRQQLFGSELLLDDQLPAGLLRMAFVVVLTLAGARLGAVDESEPRVSGWHLSVSHMIAKRTLNRPEPHGLLRLNGEQAWCILEALPSLAHYLGFERVEASVHQN
jgi:Fe-S-cluster containining protein